MRTKHKLLAGCLVLAMNGAIAQPWLQSGNTITSLTDYIGCNAASTVPLNIRHDGNFPIQWWTDQLHWMMLNPLRQPTINTFTVETNGFLGLSGNANFFNSAPGPFTRLHLADNDESQAINAQQFGFRDWQRNGITFTGNADHAYFGQEHNGLDATDMVLAWSNDFGPDELAPDLDRSDMYRTSPKGPCPTDPALHVAVT